MSEKNPHWGTTVDDFLEEEGIREAAKAEAVTRVVAWQLSQEMERQGMSKADLATRAAPRSIALQSYRPAIRWRVPQTCRIPRSRAND